MASLSSVLLVVLLGVCALVLSLTQGASLGSPEDQLNEIIGGAGKVNKHFLHGHIPIVTMVLMWLFESGYYLSNTPV